MRFRAEVDVDVSVGFLRWFVHGLQRRRGLPVVVAGTGDRVYTVTDQELDPSTL